MRNIRVGMYVFTSEHQEYRHLASYLEEFISLKEIELVLLGGTESTENKARVTSVAEELFPGMKVTLQCTSSRRVEKEMWRAW
jgi:diphthamide synthase (EF-2-diphthine--ammonia ligase)